MKFLNDFKNLFAIVGVVSIIFWTCSAESTSDNSSDNSSNTNNPPAMTGGTYQFEFDSTNANRLYILNTQTGVFKRFYYNSSLNEWQDQQEYTTTFTH